VAKIKQKSSKQLSDSSYLLKLVLLIILGTLWIKTGNGQAWQIPLPIGLILGLIIISHEKYRIDRRIDYAVLLVAMLIGFWAPIGLYISL